LVAKIALPLSGSPAAATVCALELALIAESVEAAAEALVAGALDALVADASLELDESADFAQPLTNRPPASAITNSAETLPCIHHPFSKKPRDRDQ